MAFCWEEKVHPLVLRLVVLARIFLGVAHHGEANPLLAQDPVVPEKALVLPPPPRALRLTIPLML